MQSAFASIAVIDASLSAAPTLAKLRDGYEKRMKMGPEEFSWFIFRMTNPSLRNLFMYPSNPFRAKEALLSLLAGDIYGNTPIWRALAWLKIIYYADSFWHWRRSLSAWRARRRNIVDQGPVSGENVIAKA